MFRPLAALVSVAALAACSTRPAPVAVAVVVPPPVEPAPPSMPAGAVPGMAMPVRMDDGGWRTPGRDLSGDAAAWHLRAALNVAALACRDEALVSRYNDLLASRRVALAAVEARYAAAWKAGGATDWRDRYDGQMTRAYNFYGQSFARAPFCAAATQVIGEVAAVPDAALPGVAAQHLAALERPFADFFTAYAAWQDGTRPVMALVAPVPVTPVPATPVLVTRAPVTPVRPAPGLQAIVRTASPVATAPQPIIAGGQVAVDRPVLTIDPVVFQLP